MDSCAEDHEVPNRAEGHMTDQGLDDMSENGGDEAIHDEVVVINGMDDLLNYDMKSLSCEVAAKFQFCTRDVAFEFYNLYALVKGFAARKNKILRNKKGEVVQQSFVCFRQGFRKVVAQDSRKRKKQAERRCGCHANFRVHIDIATSRWYVTKFEDEHNHDLLNERHVGRLALHRRLSEGDVMQLNGMRNAGIGVTGVYNLIASQSGGFDRVPFTKMNLHNQIGKQRRKLKCDVQTAIEYLKEKRKLDPQMFWRHHANEDGKLQLLFWSDGISQKNYEVFGDVVAFDATYRKNKYQYPFVMFSGVNNHNQTTVFASAIIANETEETYIWLLERLVEAMKGKCPTSVITDGHLSMKNAITTVFPSAHHRLCAWHLLQNATRNIKVPGFTAEFQKCMLVEYEVGEFKQKWDGLVTKFGVEDKEWVTHMYENRKMWAVAHIRGCFFAGFRTTSRCESLHSEIKKFIHSRYNLTEFLKHFERCLNFMRFREVEADLASVVGKPPLETPFKQLEKSAASLYTPAIFEKFRGVILKAFLVYVSGRKMTACFQIFTVSKFRTPSKEWHVSFYPPTPVLKCSCQRMESIGLPCEHIVAVMVILGMREIPTSLVLHRWTKRARDSIECYAADVSANWGPVNMARHAVLLNGCREMCKLAGDSLEDFTTTRELVTSHTARLKSKQNGNQVDENIHENNETENNDTVLLRNPDRAQRPGGGASTSGTKGNRRRKTMCSVCKTPGHNKASCRLKGQIHEMAQHVYGGETQRETEQDPPYYSQEFLNNEDLLYLHRRESKCEPCSCIISWVIRIYCISIEGRVNVNHVVVLSWVIMIYCISIEGRVNVNSVSVLFCGLS
ncbi:protein FAR1-RELATED SEQUENCE 5-like [Lotus japonicus]|uniref:protein FAR1-RELATED SEQUENCE 5-like n=1 Tax=Lotus japonicus TaxID=34305 RepID=UPI00258A3220|nr:protein FAR1-RELATED SEQUENCE 5-like [Lotus japonicus]